MAKIKFGMMMTDARGKLGGQVFSKNRSGAYVRTKVTPVNPRSTFQQENRSLLGSLSSEWSGLTEEQRLAWNGAVESWQKTNVFGDLQKPTGKNLFTGLNKVRLSLFSELPTLVLPPTKTEFPAFYAVSGSYVKSTGAFAIQLSENAPSNSTVRVRATPAVSPGVNYVTNLLRQVGGVLTVTESQFVLLTASYADRFGSVAVGMSIFVEITPVAESGQLGVPSIIKVISV